jgi:UDPglucose 6-dehydrogenase
LARIGILGSGVVGTCVGKGLEQLHHQVKFYDISAERVGELQRIGLAATTSLDKALEDCEISIVCVPTPTVGARIDLNSLQSLVRELAICLKGRAGYHLVVIKSTVIPTTTETLVIPILEQQSGRKIGSEVGVCVNPEFMTEAHGSWTNDQSFTRGFFDEPIIVVGESDKTSGDKLARLYEPLRRPIIRTNLVTGEIIKYAFNCALATKISYWNEIHYICRLLNVDSETVARAAGMDPRIGTYGTVHGKAFGGKCLPKDLRALIQFVTDLGYEPKLLKAVEEVNTRIGADKGVRE